jgi:hypothetical protein
MVTTLGYIDELIRHIDSRKPIFQMLGLNERDKFKFIRPSREVASFLASNPKFSLPVLGQFYRSLADLEVLENGKFNSYVEGFEFDMLQFLPFDAFTIEFSGNSHDVKIVTNTWDIQYSKFVIMCRKVSEGVSITPYYYNTFAFEGVPEGWVTNGISFTLKYVPPAERIKGKYGKGFASSFKPTESSAWPIELLESFVSTMWPETRAVYQFLVVLNIKKGIIRNVSRTPRRPAGIGGRQTGFEYHVLEIDPDYIAPEQHTSTGTHASPRFHLRRAHLRHYDDGHIILVRQAKVGNPLRGIVEKDYVIKKKDG